ncbi:MAG TPA: hypothetical protein VH088_01965 [Terriglobales bacterium]|nr:hypothetical protein [Terriglobales bacterium]
MAEVCDPNSNAAHTESKTQLRIEEVLADLPVGTWAALSLEDQQVLGTGPSRDAAVQSARKNGHNILNLVRVAAKSPLGLAS